MSVGVKCFSHAAPRCVNIPLQSREKERMKRKGTNLICEKGVDQTPEAPFVPRRALIGELERCAGEVAASVNRKGRSDELST
jgi:hypothetical protein